MDPEMEIATDEKRDDRLGFDELDAKSPLLRYTSLSDVNISYFNSAQFGEETRIGCLNFWRCRLGNLVMVSCWPLRSSNIAQGYHQEPTPCFGQEANLESLFPHR